MKINKSLFVSIGTLFVVLLSVSVYLNAGTISTSSITAQTIIDRAERTLNSASDSFYNTADYLQWIDEGVREIVNTTGCLEAAPATISLLDGVRRYSLGQPFLQIMAIEHDNGDTTDPQQIITLDRIHKNDMGHNDSTGRPRVYNVWNDNIEIWPIPRAADEAGTNLYVYSVSLPSSVTATASVIDTPAYMDTPLVFYVVSMAHYKDDQFAKGDKFLALFYNRLESYLTRVLRRKPIE